MGGASRHSRGKKIGLGGVALLVGELVPGSLRRKMFGRGRGSGRGRGMGRFVTFWNHGAAEAFSGQAFSGQLVLPIALGENALETRHELGAALLALFPREALVFVHALAVHSP